MSVGARSLEKLDLSTSINLIKIDLSDTIIEKELALPPQLQILSLNAATLEKASSLPKSLHKLIINNADLEIFQLPQGIKEVALVSPSGSSWDVRLPTTLTKLSIENDELESLPDLPPSLSALELTRKTYTSPLRINAPARLVTMQLHGVTLTKNWEDLANWEKFSESLISLTLQAGSFPETWVDGVHVLKLVSVEGRPLSVSKWPSKLKSLRLERFIDGYAPRLPEGITTLELPNTKVIRLSDLSAANLKVESLVLENWDIVDLASVPETVVSLDLSGVGNILNIEHWPSHLVTLVCERCRHRDILRYLPATVQNIDIDESRGITEIPMLPALRKLSARGSDIRELPAMMSLTDLDLCGTNFGQLSNLPTSLKRLAINEDRLISLPALTSLSELMIAHEGNDCADASFSKW